MDEEDVFSYEIFPNACSNNNNNNSQLFAEEYKIPENGFYDIVNLSDNKYISFRKESKEEPKQLDNTMDIIDNNKNDYVIMRRRNSSVSKRKPPQKPPRLAHSTSTASSNGSLCNNYQCSLADR